MKKEIKKQEYKAILIGRDNFIKEMAIRCPVPQIFIPKLQNVSCYLGEPHLLSSQVSEYREFLLERDESFKNTLVYRESAY
jgi:hypothetical protein